jgi:cyclophilin family peptidyl-prolyl cis-trans isomerase
MVRLIVSFFLVFITGVAFAQKEVVIKKKDRKRDVLLQTNHGDMVIRLSDSTPVHRDNFLKLVKTGFYDSILFHRVIKNFMIQGGDPNSKLAPGAPRGADGPGYTLPAEFRPGLFHKKGMVAAARTGDEVNPQRASSGSQFYIVQGRTFTDAGLDSVETFRLKRTLPPAHREVYKTLGGTPHLDQGYTIFGELVSGFDVLDKIAATPVNGSKPVEDAKIIKAKLIKRKKKK